ncbi:hypothetical protein PHBOTO_002803, partial [Pseudozyma hubeiensis]
MSLLSFQIHPHAVIWQNGQTLDDGIEILTQHLLHNLRYNRELNLIEFCCAKPVTATSFQFEEQNGTSGTNWKSVASRHLKPGQYAKQKGQGSWIDSIGPKVLALAEISRRRI